MGVVNIADLSEVLTGTAPSLATEGVALDFGKSYRIVVSANSGQTLSGAGTLQAYFYNPSTGWGRNPDLDLAISTSGVQSQVFPDVLIGPAMGRFRFVCSGVTVSSGTTVNVHYEVGN